MGEKLMAVKALYDWRGNKIEVGDVILYAVKHSTSVEVNEAVVKGFGENESWRGDPESTIQVDWVRSSDGDWSAKWRKVKSVTITNIKSVTLITKGEGK
jgi:hypothetical protein